MHRRYVIRDHEGQHVATHAREEGADGKRMWWERPDGTLGLGSLKLSEMPCYLTELVACGDVADWVWVVEGERAAEALVWAGELALGTVTGAAACPTPQALTHVAVGRKFLLWPDNDEAGRRHMTKVGHALIEAGAKDIVFIDYRPETEAGRWPKGADAADVIGPFAVGDEDTRLDREALARAYLRMLALEWGSDLPPEPIPVLRPRVAIASGYHEHVYGSVSEALQRLGITNASPGRNVRCPKHDDKRASLSILRDDERAICKSPECVWSGRGVIAADIV